MSEYYEWRQKGEPAVLTHPRVLAGLAREPRDEFEGVLLGGISPERREIVVEDYAPADVGSDPVPSRHSLPVVGHFRVARGEKRRIGVSDRDRFLRRAPEAVPVLLLFERSGEGLRWADVFARTGATLHDPAAPRPLDADPDPERPGAPPRRKLWSALVAVVAGVAIGAVYVAATDHAQRRPAAPSGASAPAPKPPLADWKPVREATPAPPPAGEADRSVDPAKPADRAEIQRDVRSVLARWRDAILNGDYDAYANLYAPTVGPYFRENRASRADIAAEVRRMAARYGPLKSYRISNLTIAPVDANHAVANFRKEWHTAGNRFAGAEKAQLHLARSGADWAITSEQELQVYWSHKR